MSLFDTWMNFSQEDRIDRLEKQIIEQQEQILKLAKIAENHGQWIEYLTNRDTNNE